MAGGAGGSGVTSKSMERSSIVCPFSSSTRQLFRFF